MAVVERVLGGGMGARFPGRGRASYLPPAQTVALWFLAYALLWLAAAQFGDAEPRLTSLLAWGAGYFGCALYLARQTTDQLYRTIETHILPFASAAYLNAVEDDLRRRYPLWLSLGLPLLAAAASLVAAGWALALDLGLPPAAFLAAWSGERLLWAVSYFFYFFTAALAVVAARFYLAFARALDLEMDAFYVLGAADTPLIRGLSRLATQVLIFWTMIFLSIVTIMLLVVLPPEGYEFPLGSRLLFTIVPIAGFFSLGFGTLIYLASEAKIRATLQRFASREVHGLQLAGNRLLRAGIDCFPFPAPDGEEVDRIAKWQDRVIAGTRYGNRVAVSVSVALPLVMPIVSVIVNVLTRR